MALVGGPMYDHLAARLDPDEIDVVVRGDHPTLNAAVSGLLGAGGRLDLISTHSKYAPSQSAWLADSTSCSMTTCCAGWHRPPSTCAGSRARYSSAPRLIDVRILWLRADRTTMVPDTFDALVASDLRFGFPGRESGLFGTFFELVVGMGGQLFDEALTPTMDTPECVAAIETLCALGARVPGLDTWHYDEVDAALLDGRLDAAAAWPGGWGAIATSPLAGVLEPHPYPAGPGRRVSYAGCHSWAIPVTCAEPERAADLLARLCGEALQGVDAAGGSMCANVAALEAVAPSGPTDAARLEITRTTIAESMITYPPQPRFPEIEEAGWRAIQAALRGGLCAEEAATRIQVAADAVLGGERGV